MMEVEQVSLPQVEIDGQLYVVIGGRMRRFDGEAAEVNGVLYIMTDGILRRVSGKAKEATKGELWGFVLKMRYMSLLARCDGRDRYHGRNGYCKWDSWSTTTAGAARCRPQAKQGRRASPRRELSWRQSFKQMVINGIKREERARDKWLQWSENTVSNNRKRMRRIREGREDRQDSVFEAASDD